MTASNKARWGLVSTTGVLTGIGHGFSAFAVSALLKPLALDLDTGRGAISTAIGLGRLVSGIMSPIVGHATDRWGTRWVSTIGIALAAVGLTLVGLVRNEWELYLAWSLVFSAGTAVGFTVTLDKLVVSTIADRRGMALAIRFSIAAVVSTILVPVVSYMVEAIGWRQTAVFWGIVLLAMTLVPILWFRDRGTARPVAGAGLNPDGLRTAIKDRNFWVIAVAFAAQAAVTTGLAVHLVPMMTDYGLEATVAGSLFGLMILLSIPVRLLSGYLADKVETRVLPLILGGLLVLEGIAIASFAIAPSLTTMLILIGALGVAAGAPTLLVLVLCSKLFGERGFATIQGSLMLLQVPGTMIAPIAAGYLFDFTGHYELVTAIFAFALVIGGSLVATCIRVKPLEIGS